MSEPVQKWIATNMGGLKTLVNDKLAKRSGLIGGIFKRLEIGERQMGRHTFPAFLKGANQLYMLGTHMVAVSRPVASRLVGVTYGPLNFTGIMAWLLFTGCIVAKFQFQKSRENMMFNEQDKPQYWFSKYKMMFPPQMMNNITSAHYIEINHIFVTEMFKKYRVARQEMIVEREEASQKDRLTKYILNSNYIYEPMGQDDPELKKLRTSGKF